MNRPNILYIHSHDTGRHISPFGVAMPTPHLQQLAEAGILFRQMHCSSPSCSASRAALLTGQCAHSSGMLGLAHRGWKLHDYGQHLIRTLAKNGYWSALCGVQHIAAGPDSVQIIGYDELIEATDARARHVAPAASQWLKDRAQTDSRTPFFLDVGFLETHTLPNDSRFGDGLFGCKKGDARYVAPAPALPDTPQTRQDMAHFAESAKVLDEGIGEVLRALDESGLGQNTLVIYTTDHGVPLPNHKCNLFDGGTGVALILRGPNIEAGAVSDALLSHIDVFPTLCDYLEIEPPTHLQGRSFLPILRGETLEINAEIFTEITHHAAYQPMRAARTARWKYIRHFGERESPVLPNTDDSQSKTVWVESGWRGQKTPREGLFDLVFDPHEKTNLAAEVDSAIVLNDMRGRLNRWMQSTNDPLLYGPVPVPPGTMEKDPDDVSPSKVGH